MKKTVIVFGVLAILGLASCSKTDSKSVEVGVEKDTVEVAVSDTVDVVKTIETDTLAD